ncbi:UPF0280 family protein [Eubacteriales bacterium OttesenSCG-928-N14]|nr:UPF0280 family protein [Eubacteriales bacterium OttesenSCG-928-N14]
MNNRSMYRALHQGRDLFYHEISYGTASLCIGIAQEALPPLAAKLLRQAYDSVQQETIRNPAFLVSLAPLAPMEGAAKVPLAMYRAALAADVGPMASVAGAIAEYVSCGLGELSPNNIVENGGDLYLMGDTSRTVAIYAGDSPLSNRIGLAISAEQLPLSVCTSSATIGHSLSLGKADAAIILAKSGALADAAATTLGNAIVSADALPAAIERASKIEGVLGAVGIIGDALAAWGDVEIVKL